MRTRITATSRDAASERSEEARRLKSMAAVAAGSAAFRPAHEVLLRVQAVPTILVGVDWATHVGGQPIRRVQLVHGRSNHGKSLYGIGVGVSFLKRGHYFKLWDTERTTPQTWIERMAGQDVARHPCFHAMKPATYEDFRADFREWAMRIGNAKAKGRIPGDVSGVGVVDCINKLSPRDMWDKLSAGVRKQLEKEEAEAASKKKGSRVNGKTSSSDERDGAGGRGGQIKAALNSAFLNEAVPICDDAGLALILIARERENPNASMQEVRAGSNYTVQGGTGLIYDASLRTRVERATFVYRGGKYDAENPGSNEIYGERIRVRFAKTKISGKEGRENVGYFHTSNGVLTPVGFDRARDLIEVGLGAGVVELSGSSYYHNGERIGRGIDATVRYLTTAPRLMDALEAGIRDKMPDENRGAA